MIIRLALVFHTKNVGGEGVRTLKAFTPALPRQPYHVRERKTAEKHAATEDDTIILHGGNINYKDALLRGIALLQQYDSICHKTSDAKLDDRELFLNITFIHPSIYIYRTYSVDTMRPMSPAAATAAAARKNKLPTNTRPQQKQKSGQDDDEDDD